ncbi:SRPBCC family protein [Nocardia sp. NPDC005978]|uniref:SRPBCC family protein n=1 Tax=unclassified Nocardia TaxID=2637762 RepID=UPI0033B73B7C
MAVISVARTINAPVERVWAVLTDLDHAADTLTGVRKVERLAGEGYGVGTRWRETRAMFGKEAAEEMEVAEVSPPNRTVVVANSRGVDYRTEITVEPRGTGSELTFVFSGETQRPSRLRALLERVTMPLAASMTKKMIAADLADIARVAEAG